MSLLATVLSRVHPFKIACRHASTQVKKPKPQRILSDEKLRALISLYHQADTFITLENLSQRIDEAFVSSKPITNYLPTVPELQKALADQRKAPKIAEWDQEAPQVDADTWSTVKSARELKVVEALYGVDIPRQGSTLPGLDVLVEAVNTRKLPPPLTQEEIQEMLDEETRKPAAGRVGNT